MWRLIVDRMMRKKRIVNLGVVLLFTTYGFAQQEPIFNGYLFNQFIINPAYANADGVINGSLYARNQWGGFNGAPNTQSISVHGPLGIAQKNGFGIQCINEQIGSFKTFKSMASYSYKINLSIGYLCLGLRGGIINYTIDKSKLDYKDASDPRSLQLMNNMLLPNFDAGLYYYSNNYFVSLSCNHLMSIF
jgi:type IX secretion system PorP/SprF family membrane protein